MDLDALRAIGQRPDAGPGQRRRAEASAVALQAALVDAEVSAEFDARTDKHLLRISRRHHGNIKSSVITQDFLHGADYAALKEAGLTFKGLLGADAIVRRGEGERMKEQKVADFRAAMAWLMQQAESAVGRQRYKGLGEMNPEQLWETTMDPTVRRLLRVQIDDAIEADRVFTMLMGDEVEPRRDFIERMRCGRRISTTASGRRGCPPSWRCIRQVAGSSRARRLHSSTHWPRPALCPSRACRRWRRLDGSWP
jgi:DNA gyrase subunit B